jgi:hypothetical protein
MVTAKISAVPLVSVGSAAAAHGASAATTSAVAAMDHCHVECVMARGDPVWRSARVAGACVIECNCTVQDGPCNTSTSNNQSTFSNTTTAREVNHRDVVNKRGDSYCLSWPCIQLKVGVGVLGGGFATKSGEPCMRRGSYAAWRSRSMPVDVRRCESASRRACVDSTRRMARRGQRHGQAQPTVRGETMACWVDCVSFESARDHTPHESECSLRRKVRNIRDKVQTNKV